MSLIIDKRNEYAYMRNSIYHSSLIFYTIGVWSEKLQSSLKRWHIIMFWIGLIFDTTGTTLMSKISGDVFQFNFHGIKAY